ncbi:MAG: Zn-dependent hydrolase [Subtercola sp.]|nr:Zn-dependent hydrolase [Subtercola sp.]
MTRVDAARLQRDLETLGAIGRHPGGGITRTAFSAEDAEARQWYQRECEKAGLDLELDGLGNMFVSIPGASGEVAGVWSGSHLDTVPNGGAYDGALGAVAALECLRRIRELGISTERPVRAVVFSDEEGNYGSLLGSLGLRAGYTAQQLGQLTGRDGDRLVDALAAWPWASGSPAETRLGESALAAFVELHIEQGPKLEASATDIGVVSSIVCLGGARLSFVGQADHAGTTPMLSRSDALVAASDFIARIPELAMAVSPNCVATCGFTHVHPGAANVVPGEVECSLDFRDPDLAVIEKLGRDLEAMARMTAERHGVTLLWAPSVTVPPVPMHGLVQRAVADAADELGLSRTSIASGAGHDSQNMAHLAPTGMIFVPSVGGRSHSPAEFTAWSDVTNGANVLLATVLRLAGRQPVSGRER